MTKLNSCTVVDSVFVNDATKPSGCAGQRIGHCCRGDDVIAVDVHIRYDRNAIADVGWRYMPTLPVSDSLAGQILDCYA